MMARCWNLFCIAGDCDGVAHVDATGDTWEQRRGFAYNPATGIYDFSEHDLESTGAEERAAGNSPNEQHADPWGTEGRWQ
jgi:hypothetical protein